MALRRYGGKLLRTAGGLAGSVNCCCGEAVNFCGGCSGVSEIPFLQIDFDATGTLSNNGANSCECTDGDCEAFGGTYILPSTGAGIGLATCDEDDAAAATCTWGLQSETVEECVGGITGFCYPWWTVKIGKIGTNWYLVVALIIVDDLPSGAPSGQTMLWVKDLGTSMPVCVDIFPVTLTSADYGCPTGFVAEVTLPCLFGDAATITVDIP